MGKDADCCDACKMFGHQTEPPPPPPPRPEAKRDQVKLVVRDRDGEREFLPSGERMTLGRSDKCDIAVKDYALSRVQCIIFFDDERGLIIKDSGSTCGTIVDGRKIGSAVRLDIGSTVYFGNSILRVVAR